MLDSQMEKWTTFQEAEEWFNNHDIDSKLKHIKLFSVKLRHAYKLVRSYADGTYGGECALDIVDDGLN